MPRGFTIAMFVLTCVVSCGLSWSWGSLLWTVPGDKKIQSAGQVAGIALGVALCFAQMKYFLVILCRQKNAILAYYAMWMWSWVKFSYRRRWFCRDERLLTRCRLSIYLSAGCDLGPCCSDQSIKGTWWRSVAHWNRLSGACFMSRHGWRFGDRLCNPRLQECPSLVAFFFLSFWTFRLQGCNNFGSVHLCIQKPEELLFSFIII